MRLIRDGRNLGLAARLNQGIDLASGRFIARMDQDDLCFPQRLARQTAFIESRPDIDLVAARAVVFRDAVEGPLGLLAGPNSHARIVSRPWLGLPMPHPSWFGRAEWFRRHRYWLPEYVRAEDQEILLRAMPTSRYEVLEEVLLAYRVTGFDTGKLMRGRLALLRVQCRHFSRWLRLDWLALALAVFAAKAMLDRAHSWLQHGDRAFFRRFGGPVPDSLANGFHELARLCGTLNGRVEGEDKC